MKLNLFIIVSLVVLSTIIATQSTSVLRRHHRCNGESCHRKLKCHGGYCRQKHNIKNHAEKYLFASVCQTEEDQLNILFEIEKSDTKDCNDVFVRFASSEELILQKDNISEQCPIDRELTKEETIVSVEEKGEKVEKTLLQMREAIRFFSIPKDVIEMAQKVSQCKNVQETEDEAETVRNEQVASENEANVRLQRKSNKMMKRFRKHSKHSIKRCHNCLKQTKEADFTFEELYLSLKDTEIGDYLLELEIRVAFLLINKPGWLVNHNSLGLCTQLLNSTPKTGKAYYFLFERDFNDNLVYGRLIAVSQNLGCMDKDSLSKMVTSTRFIEKDGIKKMINLSIHGLGKALKVVTIGAVVGAVAVAVAPLAIPAAIYGIYEAVTEITDAIKDAVDILPDIKDILDNIPNKAQKLQAQNAAAENRISFKNFIILVGRYQRTYKANFALTFNSMHFAVGMYNTLTQDNESCDGSCIDGLRIKTNFDDMYVDYTWRGRFASKRSKSARARRTIARKASRKHRRH